MSKKWIFNGKIIGNPYQVYDELINRDIASLPHTRRRDDDWFFFQKRKSYIKTRNNNFASSLDTWRFTDSIKVDNSWCKWWECYKYYYLVNINRTKYTVLKKECWSCDFELVDNWDRCICADDKFSKVFWRRWPRKWLDTLWEVYNKNLFWYINVGWSLATWFNTVQPWDYIFLKWITWWSSAPCWQIRQVLSVEPYDWTWIYEDTIQVNWQRDWLSDEDLYPWAIVELTQDVWEVPSYIWEEWIITIIDWSRWDVICDYWDASCIQSVEQHNWSLTYLNDKWFNFFWWAWLNSSSINWNNVNFVWQDKIDSVSFRNFLVFFWNNSISTIVFDQMWQQWFHYNLRNDIWIHNKWAHALFDNWLFFIGSDNRIYWASINSSGNSFNIDLEDITKNVFSHMEQVQPWDDVYMSSYGNRLYIFLTWKDSPNSHNASHTKILIYDKTYWIWLVHVVCSEVITWAYDWEFLWDSVYRYCWWLWDWLFWQQIPYTARAEAIIYKNDKHWMSDQDWLWLDMFRKHTLVNGVFLLWLWRYSEDTYIQVDKYNNYKYSRRYDIDTNNEAIDNRNGIINWDVIEPSDCFIGWLSKCDNVKNPYKWSQRNYNIEDEWCWTCDERIVFDEYCVKYDDNWYAVSPVHKFQLTFDEDKADYWRVSFVSWWNDIALFWWMLINTKSDNAFTVDVDNFTSWCCSPGKSCPANSCWN